eukprot:c29131_g1_i2 orf=96-1376(+)
MAPSTTMDSASTRGNYGSFSVAVIGLGLIGSAACRHLSLLQPSVIGIGPPEPPDWSSHIGVFASHYDQGRLTRIVDPDPIWSLLAARSMARYDEIENRSGICFHGRVGSIRVTPFYGLPNDTLKQSLAVGTENGAEVEMIESSKVAQERFPYFGFHARDAAIMEHGGAGFINPRELVKAQLAVAAKNGALVLPETVTKIHPTKEGLQIITDGGKTVLADRALVCAGSYSGFLLPRQRLDLRTEALSVVLAEVDFEEQQRLAGMPSFIWRLQAHPFLHSVYGCPPIRYPDGKVYIKIGGIAWDPIYLSNLQEMVDWFHGHGDPEEVTALMGVLKELLPHLSIVSLKSMPCMISYTHYGYPYIDAVDDKPENARLFVAAGGCGTAAKSSDEIGLIAALLVKHAKWTYDLDASLFRAVFAKENFTKAKL